MAQYFVEDCDVDGKLVSRAIVHNVGDAESALKRYAVINEYNVDVVSFNREEDLAVGVHGAHNLLARKCPAWFDRNIIIKQREKRRQ